MKKVMIICGGIFFASFILIRSFVGGSSKEPGATTEKVTICECENLYWDYSDKKEKAKTEKERIQLSTEELKKNTMCYKLEKSLGSKLEAERSKCK